MKVDIQEMDEEEIIEEIQTLCEKREFAKLKNLLSEMNPADIARVLDEV